METSMIVQIPEIDKYVREMVRKAYEIGIEDGRKKFSFPPLLTQENLKEIFQVKQSTVDKLISIRGFPVFEQVRARYPRDLVFKWIEENSDYLQEVAPNYLK